MRSAFARGGDGALDEWTPQRPRHAWPFAGRAQQEQAVHAAGDLKFDQAIQRGEIKLAIGRDGRDQRHD